jgi:predicted phosphodiesterase
VEAEFNRAFVVSDLHLGGVAGFQMFSAGIQFKKLCENIAALTNNDNPTLLLINGDFVDFLAEPDANYWNGTTATWLLTNIAGRREFKPVFEGLQKFVSKPGSRLVIVLGNHDLELSLPDVKAKLVELIAGNVESRRSRIEFSLDGTGYRFQVGSATALATHGNEVDKSNFTRFDILNQIIRELQLDGVSQVAASWKPSAGTVFVIDAVNKLKKQFPFVDLLKPESVAFLCLVILAPSNLAMADEFASMVASTSLNERNRPASERRFLELDPADSDGPRLGGAALERKANAFVRKPNLNVDDLIYGSTDGTLGVSDWIESARTAVTNLADKSIRVVTDTGEWVGNRLSEASKIAHAAALRNALKLLVENESPQVRTAGEADLDLLKVVKRNYDVVFAGHTHARRFCSVGTNVRHFVNTGTWAGLMSIRAEDVSNSDRFRKIYDLLIGGSRNDLVGSSMFSNECPVARLERVQDKVTLDLLRVDSNGTLCSDDLSGKEFRTAIH